MVLNSSHVTTATTVQKKWNSLTEYIDIYVETTDNKTSVVETIIPFDEKRPYGPILLLVNISTDENRTPVTIAKEYEIDRYTYVTLFNDTSLIEEEIEVIQHYSAIFQ